VSKQKRYYQVGETVYVKGEKAFGVIKGLNLNPSANIYKATVEITKKQDDATLIRTLELNLWEIDKDKRKSHNRKLPVGLDKGFFQVRGFHKAFGHPIADKPTMLDKERAKVRTAWTVDEVQREFLEATDVVGQADAIIDGIYFLLGSLVEMGVKPDRLFDIVQEANMGKLHEVDGKMVAVYREDGKVKKPEGWEENFAPEPRLRAEIERQSK
jgi:predicted HAD superfamily Cof-like phosphohydrolase